MTNDWFVAASHAAGDGSREKPFHDPWLAFKHAEPGDRIHIAAGTYHGRFDRSSWVVDCPELTVLGGYSPDFATRTPWRTPTILAARAGLRVQHEPNMLQGLGEHAGLVLDGLFFDAADRNDYDEQGGLRSTSYGDGPIASLRGERIVVRNCVFANGSAGAVELGGNGGRFENNLVTNFAGLGLLTVRDSDDQDPIVVRGNTFCFAHDDSDPPRGEGADKAIGIRVNGPVTIEQNLFVGCGNAAVACYRDVSQVAVGRNLFSVNLCDLVRSRVPSAEAEITEEYLEEIEDVGLRSAAGNTAGDPHLSGLSSAWVDAYTRDAAAMYARPPVAALNALRAGHGLDPLPTASGGDASVPAPVMRRLSPQEVLAITAEMGFHPVELPAPQGFQTPAPGRAYQPIDWSRLAQADPALADAAVEVRAGVGFDQNTELLADAGTATHIGVAVYEPGTDDRPYYVLTARHCLAHRQIEEATRYPRGLDVESTYLLRGTYRGHLVPNARQATTIVVDEIAMAPVADIVPASPQAGRDRFVRAGASGGDGSREAPFRDPFQALEKAEEGDRIHVAEGDYTGRLRSGEWRIPVKHLTLLGGYNADFTARDPWRHPARFVLTPETRDKGVPGRPVLTVEDSCEGLVLDGFVFDGSTYNSYTDEGSLDVGRSHSAALLDLRAGPGSLTVRNCTFVNAGSSAVQISGGSGIFENNLVVNTSGTAVRLQTAGAGPWTVCDNTILFAADPTARASAGHSTTGCLLEISGRAAVRVRSNVLAFADGVAVRAVLPGQNLEFDANVVAGNLFADLLDGRHVLIDPTGWVRTRLDAPFGSLEGNRTELANLPIDPAAPTASITRLVTLPAFLPPDLLRAAAASLGVSLQAPSTAEAPDPVKEAEPSAGDSISDLLADLGRERQELETKDTTTAPATVTYCAAYPLPAVLSLAIAMPTDQPGAKALRITEGAPGLWRAKAQEG